MTVPLDSPGLRCPPGVKSETGHWALFRTQSEVKALTEEVEERGILTSGLLIRGETGEKSARGCLIP